MDSLTKVNAAIAKAETLQPEDPAAQGALLMLTMARPQLMALLPSDAAELDELLLLGAYWALGLRSDDAEPYKVIDTRQGLPLRPGEIEPEAIES